jgi:hypothetical protein
MVHVIIPEDFVCWILWTYRSLIFYVYLSVKSTCHHLFAVVCLTHWKHLPHSRDVCSISEISFSNLSRIYSTVNCSICTSNETASIPDFSSTNIEISIARLTLIIILILYYLIIIWFFNRAYSMQAKMTTIEANIFGIGVTYYVGLSKWPVTWFYT